MDTDRPWGWQQLYFLDRGWYIMTLRNAFENLATEPKQDVLIAAANALTVSAAAIRTAVEALNLKTVAANTEAVTVANQLTQPITDAELRQAPVETIMKSPLFMRVGFAEVGSGLQGLAAEKLSVIQTGSGMSVNQSAGNLVITTGTTANAETVIRSKETFSGSLLARVKTILSQRIANNTFRVELADLIGEALAFTVNSATSVTVQFPTVNPFTTASVGQFCRLSCIQGAAGIPGRYAITSVSGLSVTFTVASWPVSGSGTLTLYGHSWLAIEYSGTTATSAFFDAQRRGWASGNTTATINTTASSGHVAQLAYDVHTAGLSDALVASATGYQWTQRASRVENLPDLNVPLYLILVAQNGSTAPASTTTWTLGFLQVEDQGRQKVRIASSDPVGSHAQPVQVMNGISTVTANLGTPGLVAYTDGTVALAASGVFTGTSRDAGSTLGYSLFCANAYADQAGILYIQKSTDGSTWRNAAAIPLAAGEAKELIVRVTARYHRVYYVNGATAQAAFLLTSAYHRI